MHHQLWGVVENKSSYLPIPEKAKSRKQKSSRSALNMKWHTPPKETTLKPAILFCSQVIDQNSWARGVSHNAWKIIMGYAPHQGQQDERATILVASYHKWAVHNKKLLHKVLYHVQFCQLLKVSPPKLVRYRSRKRRSGIYFTRQLYSPIWHYRSLYH